MISWREKSKNDKSNHSRDSVLNALSQGQRNANTTRAPTSGPNLQGIQLPMTMVQHPRTSTATTNNSRPTTKSNPASIVSTRRSKAGSSHPLDVLPDNEDGEDVETTVLSPKPKRKRTDSSRDAVNAISGDPAASELRPNAGRSRYAEATEDFDQPDELATSSSSSFSRVRNGERTVNPHIDCQRQKRRRTLGDGEPDNWHISPPLPQNNSYAQGDAGHSTETQRQLRHYQGRNRRLRRQPAQATSSALNTRPAPTYWPQVPYPMDNSRGYQTLNGYTDSQLTQSNTMGFNASINGTRDSSLRGIANELGLEPSFYGETMEEVQRMNANGGYVNPPRRFSDPSNINSYQTIADQGDYVDAMGYGQTQYQPPRRASDPLATLSNGNAYGYLEYGEQANQGQYPTSTDSGLMQQSWAHTPYITNAGDVTADAAPALSYTALPEFVSLPQFYPPVVGNGYSESLEAEVAPEDEQRPRCIYEYNDQDNAAATTKPPGDVRPAGETTSTTAAGSLARIEPEDVQHRADATPLPSSDPTSLDAEYDAFFNFDEADLYLNNNVFDEGL